MISEVNRLAAVRSIHGKVDILFEDTSFAEAGIAEKYRQADGTLTIQRPGQVYLVIKVLLLPPTSRKMTRMVKRFASQCSRATRSIVGL